MSNTRSDLDLSGVVLRAVLDSRDVAAALRVHLSTVGRMRRRGELPMARLGGKFVITRQALLSLIDRLALNELVESEPEGGAK